MGIIEAIKRGFGIATKMFVLVLILFVFNAVWNIGMIPLTRQFVPQPGVIANQPPVGQPAGAGQEPIVGTTVEPVTQQPPVQQLPTGATAMPGPVFSPQLLIFSVIFILASVFIQGGSLGSVRDFIKTGSIKLASFPSYGFKYYLRLCGLGLLIGLLVTVIALLAN